MKLNEARIDNSNDLAYLVTLGLENSSIQSNVDAFGYEAAFKALEKFVHHNAKWAVVTAPQMVGKEAKGLDGFLFLLFWYLDMCCRGNFSYGTCKDGHINFEMKDCRMRGIFPLTCELFCKRDFGFMCEESNPELALELAECLAKGDERCLWIIKRKDGQKVTEENISFHELDFQHAPIDTRDYWAQAGSAEFFSFSTTCLVGMVDKEKSNRLLLKNAKHFGEEFGAYLVKNGKKTSDEGMIEVAHQMDSLFKMQTELVVNNGQDLEMNVLACPFHDSPIECCMQMETFKTAVLGTVSPSSKFIFKEEKGEKGCRWTLKLKAKTVDTEPKKENAKVDPINRLTDKYIDGEITEEEFRKKLAVLKELKF